ncbi:YbhB/YbcL family Raf kinase inhibitor-like protein [Candidatus Saccharibacteria bacterium]|nr:YbhB/YbcL family Raf kinase inhibitor-like protein [Candidatus Saccharibacteria bacterium]
MKITSQAFNNNEPIPLKYSAYGQNISPPLQIDEVGENTVSLVLVVEDPDSVSVEPWQHWLLWNIPPDTKSIAENTVPSGSIQGNNDSNILGYYGPRPPSGKHRYCFKLLALDTTLDLPEGSNRQQLNKALSGHVLYQAELIGLFESPS